jgi:hypothetical protein
MTLNEAVKYLDSLYAVGALGDADRKALKTVLDYLKKQDKKWGSGLICICKEE